MPVLIVCDDSDDIRQLFRLVLEQAGARVVTSADGDQAVAAVTRERPDAVLLDIDLPTVSGLEAMELMRKAGFEGPIIAVPGAGDQHTAALLLARGFTDVIHKPMPVSRLLDAVASHLPGWR